MDVPSRKDGNILPKNLISKKIYIDVRKCSMKDAVITCIRNGGGTIEDFLSKDVNAIVTDQTTQLMSCKTSLSSTRESLDHVRNSLYSSVNNRSTKSSSLSVTGRGQALLLKARKTLAESCDTGNDKTQSLIINKARDLRIPIIHATRFIRRYSNQNVSPEHSCQPNFSGLCQNSDKICIKIEDNSKLFKPLLQQFDRIPDLAYSDCSGSPFGMKKDKTNCQSQQKDISKKFPPLAKVNKHTLHSGYCEACDHWFHGTLKEHLFGDQHQKNVPKFDSLCDIISKLPNVVDFLQSLNLHSPQKKDIESPTVSDGGCDKLSDGCFSTDINEETICISRDPLSEPFFTQCSLEDATNDRDISVCHTTGVFNTDVSSPCTFDVSNNYTNSLATELLADTTSVNLDEVKVTDEFSNCVVSKLDTDDTCKFPTPSSLANGLLNRSGSGFDDIGGNMSKTLSPSKKRDELTYGGVSRGDNFSNVYKTPSPPCLIDETINGGACDQLRYASPPTLACEASTRDDRIGDMSSQTDIYDFKDVQSPVTNCDMVSSGTDEYDWVRTLTYSDRSSTCQLPCDLDLTKLKMCSSDNVFTDDNSCQVTPEHDVSPDTVASDDGSGYALINNAVLDSTPATPEQVPNVSTGRVNVNLFASDKGETNVGSVVCTPQHKIFPNTFDLNLNYSSEKTSDTKLRLRKVVDAPLAKSVLSGTKSKKRGHKGQTHLNNYWRVRKSGDCKLIFSNTKINSVKTYEDCRKFKKCVKNLDFNSGEEMSSSPEYMPIAKRPRIKFTSTVY